ncbi:MBL fold metallo-hydrolase [Oerskovia jenensis]|uniref:L-ascorbate metabolism protein UlaG (Beta-lactamase superfamily) n=1 Tax=Oerskovia jenensis TaxID=162169 RepID=A0ABS2LC85_9CELL|nr:MBL fold metallo-hydrolase [Oerskovia jenensis]MBM7477769.1 L-ascorbate metabolism protein UlaG (beta-lactamase superfamily) [Oerskovia jenensis]
MTDEQVAPGWRVTWLGHSSVVLDVRTPGGHVRIVTDPLLRRHAGLLRRRGVRPAEVWRGADAVLLSHLHHDHAELGSLRLLGDVPILTAPANARWLRSKGLAGVGLGAGPEHDDRPLAGPVPGRPRVPPPGPVREEHGAWHDVGAHVRVHLTPAVHGHRPMPHRPNAAVGHLVQSDGRTVWAVGDTEAYPGMAHLPALAGGPIDVVLVPVAGWGPRLSGGHLGPVEAARVCASVGARVAIPVHWGTLHTPGGQNLPRGWMDHAGLAFAAAVRRWSPGTRPVVLAPGESWEG